MTNEQQRLTSYTLRTGIEVYEIEQYNKDANQWYIVGDCSTAKETKTAQIARHNLVLSFDKE